MASLTGSKSWGFEGAGVDIRRSRTLEFFAHFSQNPLAVIGLGLVLMMVLAGLFAPYLAPYSFRAQDLNAVNQAPSWAHPLGTDQLGRDQFSRIIWGARTALIVAPATVSVSLILGVVFGAMAGYFGGWVDALVMRLADIMFAFPGILLALFLAATLTPRAEDWLKSIGLGDFVKTGYASFFVVTLVLGLVGWPGLARLVRGQVLAIKEEAYIEAARAVGLAPGRLLWRYLVPNALPPVIVSLSFGLGGAIVAEATLSFFGIGIQPPAASWGRMIIDNYTLWRTYPLLVWIPGIIVGAIQASFSFIGDGLNDALNPRIGR
ncbi:MAG: ABC transporter permease [Chloroflexi bacterium]|nr:ABC transporter permease [Chloroflexota bacterium]